MQQPTSPATPAESAVASAEMLPAPPSSPPLDVSSPAADTVQSPSSDLPPPPQYEAASDRIVYPAELEQCEAIQRQKVKTVLCINYMHGHQCRFGTHCAFAHGEAELRAPTEEMLRKKAESERRKVHLMEEMRRNAEKAAAELPPPPEYREGRGRHRRGGGGRGRGGPHRRYPGGAETPPYGHSSPFVEEGAFGLPPAYPQLPIPHHPLHHQNRNSPYHQPNHNNTHNHNNSFRSRGGRRRAAGQHSESHHPPLAAPSSAVPLPTIP